MKSTALRCAWIGFSLLAAACSANESNTTTMDSVKGAFQQRFPEQTVLSVTKSPLTGIYEIVVKGNKVVYVDQKVDYLFFGNLIDVKNKTNLTEKKEKELSRVDWKSLPLDLAIKEVRGKGTRQLAVFTDPDCPYCKRLEQDSLKGITDVTIYTFLYPLTQLHPDALHKSKQIWCAKDRLAAWTGYMQDGKPLTGIDNCDTPLEKIRQLGNDLGITGTPALIFSDGQIEAGALPREILEKRLNKQ